MYNFRQRLLTNIGAVCFVIATVGTGFGQWFFSSGASEKELNTNVEIASAISCDSLDVSITSLTIDLDDSIDDCTLTIEPTYTLIQGFLKEYNKSTGEYSSSDSSIMTSVILNYEITCTINANLYTYMYCSSIDGISPSTSNSSDTYIETFSNLSVTFDNFSSSTSLGSSHTVQFSWQTEKNNFKSYLESLQYMVEGAIQFNVELTSISVD